MLLTFSKRTPWGVDSDFKKKIQQGTKKHTFRQGSRFRVGDKIHFWSGSPRNKSTSPSAFNIAPELACHWQIFDSVEANKIEEALGEYPHKVAVPLVSRIGFWKIEFRRYPGNASIYAKIQINNEERRFCFTYVESDIEGYCVSVETDIDLSSFESVMNNDGLTLTEFLMWFSWDVTNPRPKNSWVQMEGQIIHWTDTKYW